MQNKKLDLAMSKIVARSFFIFFLYVSRSKDRMRGMYDLICDFGPDQKSPPKMLSAGQKRDQIKNSGLMPLFLRLIVYFINTYRPCRLRASRVRESAL